MPFEENLGVFFNLEEFAVEAIYNSVEPPFGLEPPFDTEQPFGGDGKTIIVIFDKAFSMVSPETGHIELSNPQALCMAADLPDVKHGESLTINGNVYYITSVQPDGTGLIMLVLSEDS